MRLTHLINREGASVLDVRETREMDAGKIVGAIHAAVATEGARRVAGLRQGQARWSDLLRPWSTLGDGGQHLESGWLHRNCSVWRRLQAWSGSRAASRESVHRHGTSPMYSTAICPYCIQAERLLKGQGCGQHRKDPR